MKKKSNKWLLYAVIALVGLIVFSVIARKSGWIGQSEKPTVEIIKAGKVDIIEKVGASGKIQPTIEVKISPDVSGEITELYIEEGDSVVKGQLLLRIRPDNYRVAVQRAEASLNTSKANMLQSQARVAQSEAQLFRAKADYERAKQLLEQKVISQSEYDQAFATYKVAEQELQAAKNNVQAAQYSVLTASATVNESLDNLSRTSIYAPMDGIISKLAAQKGERVVGTMQMAGTEILRIADLGSMEVQVDVNENDIVRVSLGDTTEVEVDAYSYLNKKFVGVVTSIANTAKASVSADAVTEFQVKIKILPSSYQDLITKTGNKFPFRPGMTASVEIITESKKGILGVPNAAVTAKNPSEWKARGGQTGNVEDGKENTGTKSDNERKEIVFVYDPKSKKVQVKEVKIGIIDFNYTEILEGLKEGEQIVVGPYLMISKKLRDQDEVSAQEKKEKIEKP